MNGHGTLRQKRTHLLPAQSQPLVIDRLEFSEALHQANPFTYLYCPAVEYRQLEATQLAWYGECAGLACGLPP